MRDEVSSFKIQGLGWASVRLRVMNLIEDLRMG